jgi:hypothetical protein
MKNQTTKKTPNPKRQAPENNQAPSGEQTVLVTCWIHPDCGQMLVLPGKKSATRKLAIQHMVGNRGTAKKLIGGEERWTKEQLKELPEFAG